MPTLNRLYREYKDKAHVLVIYIREAHPVDGWRMRGNDREGIEVKDPTTIEGRRKVATTCAANLKMEMTVAIDNMKNDVDKAYAGWPERLAVVGKGGLLRYYGAKGPRGFDPAGAERALKAELARLAEAGRRADALDALDDALK